mgnify:FL=1|jgi:hypothetical protein
MDEINIRLNELIKLKYEYQDKLNNIEKEISKLEIEKRQKCKHEWVTEREDCMYGKRFTYCKICGLYNTR